MLQILLVPENNFLRKKYLLITMIEIFLLRLLLCSYKQKLDDVLKTDSNIQSHSDRPIKIIHYVYLQKRGYR